MQDYRFDTDFLPARVARLAAQTPAATALVDTDGALDWATLWAWSGRLAAALADAGTQPGERVALALPRSAALVASILAVWRVRACYVPLDPALPTARLRWQAQDCGARTVIASDASVAGWLPDGVRTLDPAATRASQSDVTHTFAADAADERAFAWPAYVIYTSGSSGRPKGVVLSHRALSAYLQGVSERLPEGIRSAAYLSTPAADLGHTALFGALWHGWTLHLIDAQVAADPDAFAAYMQTQAIDLLKIVPSHLDALMQAQSPEAVLPGRCLLVGGEAAPTRLAERIAQLRPECRLINHYGPTETAVGVLTRSGVASRSATLPLGTPLAHVHARVVDADGNSVPKGATGELCIGGASVADGYLNRPSLTAERFVPDAEGNGTRVYRTGDRSRRLPSGEYAFLGRIDDQVKIRGYRVEPEEIAARLRQADGVRDAIVIARADSEDAPLRLVGYVTSSVPLDGDTLRATLAADLPDYMVPSSIMVLAALPLTANGKIDRAALPAEGTVTSAATNDVAASTHVEPRNDAERTLADVWKQVLKRDDIGVTDNFFEIGGDSILSLQIIAKARRAGLKLTPKQMFEHPTIEAAARIAQPMTATPAVAAPSAPQARPDDAWFVQAGVTRDTVEAVYPATPMQQGLLFHGMLDSVPGLYIGQLRLTLDALRIDDMRRAWQTVVARHPVLRTRFFWPAGGEPLQVVERNATIAFDVHDTIALAADEYDTRFAATRDAIAARGFDPVHAPLMRVDVFTRADGACDLLWTHHHALTDGWSTAQVIADVARAYGAIVAGETPDQTPGAPYANYVQWLRSQPDTGAFWRARLAALDDPARLVDALGPDFHAAVSKAGAAGHKDSDHAPGLLTHELGATRHAALLHAARRARVTLNTLVQGAWALVLSRFASRPQVVFGTTVSGRPADLSDAQEIVGLFINSLPLWVDVAPDAPLATWLAALQDRNAELREVEHTPLANLRQWTGLSGDALFDSLVVFENYPLDEAVNAANAALGVRAVEALDRTHLPLTLVVAPRDAAAGANGLTMQWRWDATRIEADGIARLARHVDAALDRIAAALATSHEAHDANATPIRLRDIALDVEASTDAPPAQFAFEPALARIAAQVGAQPDAVALVFPQPDGAVSTLTYSELHAWSARIARACAAVVTKTRRDGERRIGIAMGRTPALVAAILGVLRADAAYVPLDPAYPDDRLRDIALDAGLDAIVTTDAERARFAALVPGIDLIDAVSADRNGEHAHVAIDRVPHPEQLAYVIYTSGSTGRPKGVGITHANLTRLFTAGDRFYTFGSSDVWPLFHSYAFDVSVWELFGSLTHGGRLVVVPHDIARDAPALQRLLREQSVTVLNQTPSAFMPLCEIDAEIARRDPSATMDTLRYVVFAGEKLDPPALANWFVAREENDIPVPALINMYGITETTVHVTFRSLGRGDIVRAEAPSVIGGPLSDLTLTVLDPFGEPVPVGAAGELHVGGAGLARGYLGRPGLTAARFVPDPAGAPGARVYRSGDVARRLASGDIDYLGRNDSQMKVRGFRIEAGEVEAVLRTHPEVRNVVVLVRDQRLVTWIVPAAGSALTADALRAFAARTLPAHMVPSAYVLLDSLPVTQNGKLDRRALPAPEDGAAGAPYVAPRDATEAALASIWQQVLGVERVGAHDDFFLLGGHSLLAVRVISAIRATFGHAPTLRAVFEQPVLADLAASVRDAQRTGDTNTAVVPAAEATKDVADLPLSAAQTRLWFLWKLDPHSAAYNVNGALQFDGALDVAALQGALDELVARHPALRMRFGETQGVPYQTIGAGSRCALLVADLLDQQDVATALDAQLAEFARKPFDLTVDAPIRATLLRTAADRHVLHLVLHHIVSDDWSVGILFADFAAAYRRRLNGAVQPVAANATADAAYRDVLRAQAARLADGRDAAQLAYWRNALAAESGSDDVLALPYDRTRSGARRYVCGARTRVRVPANIANALRAQSRERRTTLFITLLAAFNGLLYRYSGQRDIRVGVPLAGRDAPGAADVVGFFVNTVVIRTTPDGEMRAERLVDDVRERLLAAHANQDVPFASVVNAAQPERNLAQTPLFQVLVNHQQRHDFGALFGDALRVTPREVESGEAQFDLMLNIAETADDGALDLTLTYAQDVFDATTVDRLANNFVGLLTQWSAASHTPLASFKLAEQADSQAVVHDRKDPLDIVSRFIEQAAQHGDAVALSDGATQITYAQLDAWSRAIAVELQLHGVHAETRVGVAMQRSAGLVAALLGILRAGAAYVPLDPSYPAERLAHIVSDAQLGPIVADVASLEQHAALFAAHVTLDADALRDRKLTASAGVDFRAPHPEQLAYVIYTSGSTGLPKGVGITHRNVARLFDATATRFAFDAHDVWTLFHSYAFDFSVWEIFGALVHGGRLVIVPHWTAREPAAFHRLIRDERVTVLNQTPSAFTQLIHEDENNTLDSLRAVIFGGERLDPAALVRWADGARARGVLPALVNMYGITETTVHVTHRDIDAAALRDARSVIGAALDDLTLHVLDADLNRVPLGASGEMHVGGAGLARGYLGRAALTAERFVPDPFGVPGARLYRSGDLARRLADGDLEYLGRNDHQVKIRGFRIELGEIQAALLVHPDVREAAVLALDTAGGDRRLVAYVVPINPDLDAQGNAEDWQTWLSARLPAHMVPSAFVALARFPLTPNGKLDRRALPAPETVVTTSAAVAPSTPAEETLLAVWRNVLRRDDIGVTDNFFVIGGDSILSLQIVAKAREAGLHLTPRQVFEEPTVERLAKAAQMSTQVATVALPDNDRSANSELWRALGLTPEHIEDVYPATPLQTGLLYHALAEPEQRAYLNQLRLTLTGPLDRAAMQAAWQAALERHAVLRTRFEWRHGLTRSSTRSSSVSQIVHRRLVLPFAVHDWSAATDYDARLTEWRERDLAAGIELDVAPLMRTALFIRDAQTVDLVWTHHHLLLDGWSVAQLLGEILRDYRSRTAGASPAPATFVAPAPYRRYVDWLQQSADDAATEAWWRKRAAQIEEPATLTSSLGAPAVIEPGAHAVRRALDASLGERLTDVARRHEVTLNTLMQGAWAVVLARYGHRRGIAYGTTLAGRPAHLPGVEQMLGLFVNTLPVWIDVDPNAQVGDWLRTLQRDLTDLRQYEHTPLSRVQQWTGRSGDALFDSLVVFENYPVDPAARGEDDALRVSATESVDPTHYPLALSIIPRERISLEWAWDGERIDRSTIERLSLHYVEVLEQLGAGEGLRVGALTLGSSAGAEVAQQYAFASLGEQLSAQAARSPDSIAVRCEDASLSYAQLDAWSGAIAARLVARGVRAETRVGLCVTRGPAMLAALLGVIRSGGAFVPLDPEYPAARLAQMIEDAGIVQVLADDASAERVADVLAGCEVVPVAFDGAVGTVPAVTLHPDQLAYVLYTSGSTGKPKGVAVSHGSLWTHLQDFLQTYRITSADTVLHSSTINFDVALHETLPALLTGATVEMRGVQPWDLQGLSDRLVQRQVTFARIPTALWQQWQRSAPARESLALRQVTVGGEALPGDALGRWQSGPLGGIRLDNLYGPTETTVAALYRETVAEDVQQVTVPIGKPYPGRTARVIDAFGDAAPAGGLGELCIGGPTVARGYLGRAAQTAERFVPDPYGEPGSRQYRSGDLCRMRADGTVEFLGRLDQQVKLRGQRIELGEIEAVMRQCAGVREAAVIVVGAGERQRLAGYIAGDIDTDVVQRELEQKLPAYMVPSTLTVLEKLPAMPNGKLDRAALPAPQAREREQVGARNTTEANLLSIWSAVLGRDDLGVTDNFFEVGGDSIQSLQIIARAREAGLKLTPRQVFEHPTVERLALRAEAVEAGAQDDAEITTELPLTPIQQWFFERYPQGESHWNQSVLLKVEGQLDPQALEQAVSALGARHDALRLRFVQTEAGWRQRVIPAAAAAEDTLIHRETLTTLEELDAAGQRVQSSLNLTEGPLWRVGYFETTQQETRLLVAIHHLAVDGVSWRVLLEELQTAYAQAERRETVTLPAPSTSWSAWVRRVHDYAHTPAVQAEAEKWQQVSKALDAAHLPLLPAANTRIADSETIEWTLAADRTRELLQTVPRAYRTRTDELLLAALAQALGAWSGLDEIAIELEGHGREDLIDGVDLSRTVGWFTTRFPVTLPAKQAIAGTALVAVKERLRAVPNKGMHWGWLDAAQGQRRAPVSFNYLGRFDQSLDEDSRFAFSAERAGSSLGDAARLDYALDLNGLVSGDELVLRWRFDPARIDRATVERLVAAFDREVLAMIAHCVVAAPGASASDFPLSGLDQAQLQSLDLALGGVADIYPATPLQQGLLYHSQLQQGQGVYLNQLQLTLRGPLDAAALRDAWQAAVARHEMLRTRFEWRHGGNALQIVERQAVLPFAMHDWSDVSDLADYDARLAAWRAEDLSAGVEPSRAPLMRINVFRRPDGGHDLVRTHHHVLTDGWSGARLFAEVLDDYERRTQRTDASRAKTAPASPPPYRRYVEWLAKQPDPRDWWLERLAAADDAATLTGSLAAPQADTTATNVQQKFTVTLDAALDARVRRAAQRHQVTLNTLMQGAWAVLLARLGGKRSVAFGVTVSGRPTALAGSDEMFGLFINSLPVFIGVPGDASVPAWLRSLQDYNTQMREVEHTPLSSLQQWAGRSGDALFDSLVVFENYPVAARSGTPAQDALRIDGVDAVERTHYPLTLTILPSNGLDLHWGWDNRRLERAQVEALQRQYVALLAQLSDDTPRWLGDLAVPHDAMQPEALPAYTFKPMHARFEEQAARAPQRIAVRQGETSVDYAALANWVVSLDARLRDSGVAREERVAVCMRRAPAMLASMLAVWRSGAVYVPLDPAFPLDRLQHMLVDAGVTRVLTDADGTQRLGALLDGRIAIDVGDVHDVPPATVARTALPFVDQQLAYVIYTSGSTGRPKGVGVPHGALDRLLTSVGHVPGLTPDDVLLSVTTASFDISLNEFCLPLVSGACIELADAATTGDGAALARLIDSSGATFLQPTPSGWRLLLEAGWTGPASGKLVGLASGEPLPPDLAEALNARGVEVWNMYGPTETTVWSTGGRVPAHVPVTIGRALHATTLRIVDASGQATPSGGTGELCIGGENLARGYLGRPGLTAERFVPDPWGAPGARMYRTGDLSRERPDATFDCLGRVDQQVKLRGYRIEPGEIEAVLRSHEGVLDAAVTLVAASGGAEARLVGYVVSAGDALPDDWRRMLAGRLPTYMIPAALHRVDGLPRTANGKLDRNALARLEVASDASWVEPASDNERLVAQLFGDMLGVARVGAHDDFFALGGHSLAAVRVVARLSERAGRKVELKSLFEHPTPASLGALLDAHNVNTQQSASEADSDADMQALDDLFDALD
ncbi:MULTISPECIES: non-ribosomal peptide synthetase [Paraburkholderia]|uniref:non-ribosomal peptide synthetase n=1 Tax=Paraburkholderia TaxID=1822464 RepID=UPI00224D07A4|nr:MULTISPECIES: non-ribosomal peptide synthetase [Paraburkholderia]MCX4160100.1 amino acid adenylation domain-containing protein [Paraburkholderia megapolitana]MDN7155600.1 amino acid adenylation domain-containing protein [Paraburkholderia sp. CHISQ3]MDQ6492644.1 amino acid adenylation domain-containing protein [Paraburkholderia megapolitana]